MGADTEKVIEAEDVDFSKEIGTDFTFKREIVWVNAIGFALLHVFMAIGWFVGLIFAKWSTLFWTLGFFYVTGQGVTMGAHRLYSHRSFKAKPILRMLLILFFTAAGQNCLYVWVRDHRQHHKYSDTDADPHNSNRGFFFSHMGWLMSKKHPKVLEYGKNVDMSDLDNDWMVRFQRDYYIPLFALVAVIIPVFVPIYFFGENFLVAILFSFFARYVILLNGTWLVNSAAHFFGTRPYDKNHQAVESTFASLLTSGEGWHNYHHAFPWDYKAAELGTRLNLTATWIRMFARIGWAYDLKDADRLVRARIMRTGDGSHKNLGTDEGKGAVTSLFGPVTPMNPLYTSTKFPKNRKPYLEHLQGTSYLSSIFNYFLSKE